MNKSSTTCYMCEELATSYEHVPPKCIFPEKKDLSNGVDLRKKLITVPSCEIHNSKKSNDDEYFLYVLSASLQINKIGRDHYKSKIRRAINRNPSLLKKFADNSVSINTIDPSSGEMINTFAHKLDEDRINLIIDRLARAIFYHHYNKKWLFNIKYQAEFLFSSPDQTDESSMQIKAISKLADGWFSKAIYYGENAEVFRYQAMETKGSQRIRLHFYEGCKLLLLFDN
jgi:recombination DNA repair RAD52 pathway protein